MSTIQDFLKGLGEESALARESVDARIEISNNRLQFSLWSVGLAAPGFIMLTANIDKIQGCSMLAPSTLAELYVATQAMFLAAILLAVLIYWHLNRQIIYLQSAKILSIQISTAVAKAGNPPGKDAADKASVEVKALSKRQEALLATYKGRENSFRKHMPTAQQVILLLGYVGLAVILLDVNVSKPCGQRAGTVQNP